MSEDDEVRRVRREAAIEATRKSPMKMLRDMAKPGYVERREAEIVAAERRMALTCVWCGKQCRTENGLANHELECQP